MLYNVKSINDLNKVLFNINNQTTINIENDLTLQNPIEISGLKDIKIISQNGSELTGGIVTNKWEKEGDFLLYGKRFLCTLKTFVRMKWSAMEQGMLK